jgi:hypothetical protein
LLHSSATGSATDSPRGPPSCRRFRNPDTAAAALTRVLKLGFKGSVVEPDGCGYLKVDVKGVPTLAVGRELAAEAEKVGLHVTLEKTTS